MSVRKVDNSKAVTDSLKAGVANGLGGIGEKASETAKSTVHVITGNLRDSIDYDSDDTKVVIFAGMSYSAYEELGTSRQPSHPYLGPAVLNHTDELVNILANKIKEALR